MTSQYDRHRMVDPRVQARLERFQISRPEVDLSQAQRTSYGQFWYNLHGVLVHCERWTEIGEDFLGRVQDMVLRNCDAKGFRVSRGSILPDHIHLAIGCPFDEAPADIAIGFLNNLSFVYGMRDVLQYGAFIGTFGEYTNHAMKGVERSVAATKADGSPGGSGCDHRPPETSSDGGGESGG